MKNKLFKKYRIRIAFVPLCIAWGLMAYVLITNVFFTACTTCSTTGSVVPFLGFLYFSALFVALVRVPRKVQFFSPYGLLGGAALALCMQLTLLSLCIPCYIAHICHVLFWGICFYAYYGMLPISSALLGTAIIFPLLHAAFLPTHVNLKEFSLQKRGAKGYILSVVQPGCHYCLAEMPLFQQFARKVEARGISCVVVSTSDDASVNAPYAARAPSLQMITYETSLLFPSCVIEGYPYFIIADSRGRVVSTSVGLPDEGEAYLMQQADRLLQ